MLNYICCCCSDWQNNSPKLYVHLIRGWSIIVRAEKRWIDTRGTIIIIQMTRTDHHPLGHEQYLLYSKPQQSFNGGLQDTRHQWNNIILAFNYRSPQFCRWMMARLDYSPSNSPTPEEQKRWMVTSDTCLVSEEIACENVNNKINKSKWIDWISVPNRSPPGQGQQKSSLPVTDGPPSYSAPSSNII